MLRWRSRCRAGDDGDHDGASEMKITSTRMMAISYHLYWLHVMLILYASYLALIDGSFLRWSLTKIIKKCSPWVCTVVKVLLLRHHVMIGCDRLYVQIQRVQNSCTRGILRLYLMSQAYADMASERWDRKVERESYSRYDQHSDVTIESYSISRGHGLVNMDHVII